MAAFSSPQRPPIMSRAFLSQAELYFLIAKLLQDGPCRNASEVNMSRLFMLIIGHSNAGHVRQPVWRCRLFFFQALQRELETHGVSRRLFLHLDVTVFWHASVLVGVATWTARAFCTRSLPKHCTCHGDLIFRAVPFCIWRNTIYLIKLCLMYLLYIL